MTVDVRVRRHESVEWKCVVPVFDLRLPPLGCRAVGQEIIWTGRVRIHHDHVGIVSLDWPSAPDVPLQLLTIIRIDGLRDDGGTFVDDTRLNTTT